MIQIGRSLHHKLGEHDGNVDMCMRTLIFYRVSLGQIHPPNPFLTQSLSKWVYWGFKQKMVGMEFILVICRQRATLQPLCNRGCGVALPPRWQFVATIFHNSELTGHSSIHPLLIPKYPIHTILCKTGMGPCCGKLKNFRIHHEPARNPPKPHTVAVLGDIHNSQYIVDKLHPQKLRRLMWSPAMILLVLIF